MAENEEQEETLAQPRPFPPDMMVDPESRTVAHTVRDYLWGKGPVEHQNVSAQMNGDLVSRFVAFEMKDLPPENFWRVRILADLYNLIEHREYFESLLNGQETEPLELDRSIACTIILEEIGVEAQRNRAAQYYEYLVRHRFANEKFAELIQCLAVFGNQIRPDSLRTRMEQEIELLSARERAEPELGVEKREIESLADNELFIVEEANKSRQRISEIPEPDRLGELIRVYLLLTDDGGGEYFDLWIQQQIRRTAERDGNEKVIGAFRTAIANLGKMGAKDVNFCKIRVFNAIEFFLGKLDSDEETFMAKKRAKQTDPLRYMPIFTIFEEPEEPVEEEEEEEEETEGEGEN